MVLWQPPGGAPKVQKWVSEANRVNIGQADHYVLCLEPNLVPYKTTSTPPLNRPNDFERAICPELDLNKKVFWDILGH